MDENRMLDAVDQQKILAYAETIGPNVTYAPPTPKPLDLPPVHVDSSDAQALVKASRVCMAREFKHENFRDGQEEALHALLHGNDTLAILPTGGGKSLLYQLPSLVLPHVTVVVSPLISLMKDQVDHFVREGAAVALHSALDHLDTKAALNQIRSRSKKLKLLFVSPERFTNERFLTLIKSIPISLFAVDEAHCISEWGHAFRPDYLRLPSIIQELRRGNAQDMRMLLLTATCSKDVEADLRLKFSLDRVIRTAFHRPNLHISIKHPNDQIEVQDSIAHRIPRDTGLDREDDEDLDMADMDEEFTTQHSLGPQRREAKLAGILATAGATPAIVYTTRQKSTVALASTLASALGGRCSVRPYHAGLSAEVRQEVQESFANGTLDVVVATIAFGMGINKANVRTVIHFNMPRSLEGYVQEIGRAGRDGKDSNCVTLFSPKDVRILKNYVYGEEPAEADVRLLVENIFGEKSVPEVTRDGEVIVQLNLFKLSRDLDMPQSLLARLLAYLGELKWKILREKTPMYMQYQWEVLADIPENAEGIDKDALNFIKSHAVRKRKLTHLNVDQPGMSILDRNVGERVNRILTEWSSAGYIRGLKVSQLRHRYQVVKPDNTKLPEDDILVESLLTFARDFVRREIIRVEETGWLLSQGFPQRRIQAFLAEKFGLGAEVELNESVQDILNADHKLSFPSNVPSDLVFYMGDRLPAGLLEEGGTRLAAKFLVGMSSPKIMALRLTNHKLFGELDECDFQELKTEMDNIKNQIEKSGSTDVDTDTGMPRQRTAADFIAADQRRRRAYRRSKPAEVEDMNEEEWNELKAQREKLLAAEDNPEGIMNADSGDEPSSDDDDLKKLF